jgi:aspartate aminotransferase
MAVTARAAELRTQGRDIIDLGAGEPDFDTPEHIKAAGIAAIREGKTKYTAVEGTAALKNAIIGKFRRDNHLSYGLDQILVSCGA